MKRYVCKHTHTHTHTNTHSSIPLHSVLPSPTQQDDGGDSGEAEFDTRMRDQVRKRKRQPRGEQEGGEEEETKLSRK